MKSVSKHHHSEDRMQWNHLQSHVIHGWPNVVKVLLRTALKFFLQALSAISSAFLQKRRNSEDLYLSNLNLLDGTILLEESSDLITHFLPTSSIQKKVHKQITSSSKLQFLLQKRKVDQSHPNSSSCRKPQYLESFFITFIGLEPQSVQLCGPLIQ